MRSNIFFMNTNTYSGKVNGLYIVRVAGSGVKKEGQQQPMHIARDDDDDDEHTRFYWEENSHIKIRFT